ncbi:glycoside hydrolase family 3 N-terminal domain-containing protein [Sphingobacterium oryzagri]|uniref:beta-N-acetylhexosaminidase n=1 Tax=Sphingobacterium oryzagri TaxID=3025669 RepID=A0ABY7WJX9_9SPHI|nr:glycoside hydrolase family 3 N-terminal domain-containing protein [Sphingobacterium sp. KACC 22765]WDF68907.1 glycoside hydrolase family 3 N-terminal domain-containing protein [Sphingobacterium sp. KACC 22765]
MIRKHVLLFLFLVFLFPVFAQKKPDFVRFINSKNVWVDSVFNALTPKERIAQLFLVRAHTNLGKKYIDSVANIIKKEQLGGLVVFQGGPVRHAQMLNQYQKLSKVPLLVTYDGEWGLGMRMPDSTMSYPYQMTLGAIQNEHLIYEMGKQIARDFQRLGMHFNFAPVVDINNNPNNPVINFRSFGDNKHNVTRKSKAYMDGMVDGGIIASLKHFPGHGDTDVDSHHDLPQLTFSKARLDTLEIYPFRELIKAGAPAIMVAHMNIPALDATPNIPSSISRKVVTDLLRKELGFKGLTVTDAMDMNGVKKFFPNGEADVMAIEAGHDLLEISENSARAIDLVEKAVKSGRIKQAELDQRIKRVLAAKYWVGLNQYRPIPMQNLFSDLNNNAAKQLVDRLADAAVTVLKADRRIKTFDKQAATAIVSIGITQAQDFEKGLTPQLTEKTQFFISGKETDEQLKELLKQIRTHRQIVLAIHDNRPRPRSESDLSEPVRAFVDKLAGRRTVTVMFTNPYALNNLPVDRSSGIIMAYQNDAFMQKAALRVLLGRVKAQGKLPIAINKKFQYGDGI